MENIKTITYLNSKMWYRAIKIIYILFAVPFCLYAIGMGGGFVYVLIFDPRIFEIELNLLLRIALGILAIPTLFSLIWVVLQIPKWIFYYIYLGTRTPEK